MKMPMIPGNVFSRNLGGPLPWAVKAQGVWIEDDQGNRYLDGSGGAIVVNVGHGRREIADAVRDQILKCHYAHPTMFTTPVVEELATALAGHSPKGIDRFYFMTSGSEAVETAIKLARQVHLAKNRPQKTQVISRWKSYHGLTMGALAATGRTSFRTPFMPMIRDAVHIQPPYCLRCFYGLTYPECELHCATALDEIIQNMGSEVVSAFVAETVSGATIAAALPPPGYWTAIREICDRHQVLLIQDEIMCGVGRTGRWFASEHYDVVPDMVTMGKGLSGGAVAMSAVGVRKEHYNAVRKGGSFAHGGTYSHNPVSAAAALTAVRILEKEKLVDRAGKLGSLLGQRFKDSLNNHPNVADVRGIGMLWGIEFVKEKGSLTPFPRKEQVTERLWKHLFQNGVVVYKSVGLAGTDGDALVIGPPFVITEEEIDLLVTKLTDTVNSVLT